MKLHKQTLLQIKFKGVKLEWRGSISMNMVMQVVECCCIFKLFEMHVGDY